MPPPTLEEFSAFVDPTVALETNIEALCDATWAATQDPLPEAEARALLERARAQLAEFERLLAQYAGKQRESLLAAGSQIDALRQYTEDLAVQLETR